MPTLTIDNHEVCVPPGATILDATEKLGLDVPTLCFLKGYDASASCLVCMVKERHSGQLFPACATAAVDGMEIESETDEVYHVRRTALELLLSDHVGDCFAPCFFACPAHMDIPLMLRQIGDKKLQSAIATIKKEIALPAALGRVCSKPCERGCRRAAADGPVAVCELKRHVADRDLESDDPYLPDCRPPTGKHVAIVGAGPTGLAAAYELRQAGHACTIYDKHPMPGGQLRYRTSTHELPHAILDAEIHQILRLGVDLHCNCTVGEQMTLDQLASEFDAVLVACGAIDRPTVERWGLTAARKGIEVNRQTYETSQRGIFAAGNAIRSAGLVIRSVADGKEAAQAMLQFLAGEPIQGRQTPFSSRVGRATAEELDAFVAGAAPEARATPESGADYSSNDASHQADRCLACGCSAHNHCKLEHYARLYGADPGRFAGQRQAYEVIGRNAAVQFEPGKCIKCELCVQIATQAGEPLGLTFVGRGFDVRLNVPFDGSMDEALQTTANECVAACPTGALSFTARTLYLPTGLSSEPPSVAKE